MSTTTLPRPPRAAQELLNYLRDAGGVATYQSCMAALAAAGLPATYRDIETALHWLLNRTLAKQHVNVNGSISDGLVQLTDAGRERCTGNQMFTVILCREPALTLLRGWQPAVVAVLDGWVEPELADNCMAIPVRAASSAAARSAALEVSDIQTRGAQC